MPKIRIFIIDDSLTIRAMVEQILGSDPNIQIVGFASNADEAEDFLENHIVDVITLDIAMPGIDGLHFLSALMARAPLPVVMLSGKTAKGCAACDDARRRGAVACFDKARLVVDARSFRQIVKGAAKRKVSTVANDIDEYDERDRSVGVGE